jgi:hypothetical protein
MTFHHGQTITTTEAHLQAVCAEDFASGFPVIAGVYIKELPVKPPCRAQSSALQHTSKRLQRILSPCQLSSDRVQANTSQHHRKPDDAVAFSKDSGAGFPHLLQESSQVPGGNKRHVTGQENDPVRPAAGEGGEDAPQRPTTRHEVAANHSNRQLQGSCGLPQMPDQGAVAQAQLAFVPAHPLAASACQHAKHSDAVLPPWHWKMFETHSASKMRGASNHSRVAHWP